MSAEKVIEEEEDEEAEVEAEEEEEVSERGNSHICGGGGRGGCERGEGHREVSAEKATGGG